MTKATIVSVKITEDLTENKFGVEGYQVQLSTRIQTINAFVNSRNVVTTQPAEWLHGLFDNAPFTSEFVFRCEKAVQKAFENWTADIKMVKVEM